MLLFGSGTQSLNDIGIDLCRYELPMKDILVVPTVFQLVGRSGDQIETELLQSVQHFTKLTLRLGRIPFLVVNQAFFVVPILLT